MKKPSKAEYEKALEIVKAYEGRYPIQVFDRPTFHSENLPIIAKDETGYLNMYTPSGELIYGNIFVRVHDQVRESLTAVCKFNVNLGHIIDESNSLPWL